MKIITNPSLVTMSKSEDCVIDIPFTRQDEISDYRISRCLTDSNRYPSQSSSLNSNSADICRICHCEGAPDLPLITPCYCAGSLRYVHQTCLQQWIKSSNIKCCELCKFQFIMQTKVKPFSEWEYLEMSGLERKKLACAMLFHIIAMTCVCWSLYVLIDRTMDEVYKGHLEWPFWTKLIVVGIGFMGGIVFMYIQCRAYFVLCKRWKAYNRVIYVQNAPEKLTSRYAKQHAAAAAAAPITSPDPSSGPSCSFKTSFSDSHKRSGGGGVHETTNCIDIKGVRNLHIFFGGENQIRVHRNDRGGGETRVPLTHEEQGHNRNRNHNHHHHHHELTRVSSKGEKYGNTSLRIQIGGVGNGGGGADRSASNGGVMASSNVVVSDPKMVVGPLKRSAAECQPTMVETISSGGGGSGGGGGLGLGLDKRTSDEFKGGDQSVVKLQIKKAEIVIEFGKQHHNGEEPPLKMAARRAVSRQRPQQEQQLHQHRLVDCVDSVVDFSTSSTSPKRKFSSEEYLDSEAKYGGGGEKVANEAHESPTSQLLVSHRNCNTNKVPYNNFFKERTSLKDWRSSEDLLDVKSTVSKF